MSDADGQRSERARAAVLWAAWGVLVLLWATGAGVGSAVAGGPVVPPQTVRVLPWGTGKGQVGLRVRTFQPTGMVGYEAPRDFDTDHAGNLYLADPVNRRIVVLAPGGQWKATIPVRGGRHPVNYLAVQPSGAHVLTRQVLSGAEALCVYDRRGTTAPCQRLPSGFVFGTLARSIGITDAGTDYALAFHRVSHAQHDALLAFRDPHASPEVVLSTEGVADPLNGPRLGDFALSEGRVLVAVRRKDPTEGWTGKYVLLPPAGVPIDYPVPYEATGRFIGFVGPHVAALPGDLSDTGPADVFVVTLAGAGVVTRVAWTLPYPAADILTDLDGTRLVFRLVAPQRILAIAATRGGLVLAQYNLPPHP